MAIDKALVAGEPLRNIAKRVSVSPAGLLRHKSHVAQAIMDASERREERLGDNLLEEMRRVQRKAWELLSKTESEGDHRGAIVALREVRECLGALGELLGKAGVETGLQEPNKIVIKFMSPSGKPMERDANGMLVESD